MQRRGSERVDSGSATRTASETAGALREIRPQARRPALAADRLESRPSCRLFRTAASGSDGRFLAKPLQRFSGKAAVRWYIPSYERDVFARTRWEFQRSARRNGTASGDAFLSRQFRIGFAECPAAGQRTEHSEAAADASRADGQLPPQDPRAHQSSDLALPTPSSTSESSRCRKPFRRQQQNAASTRTTPAS